MIKVPNKVFNSIRAVKSGNIIEDLTNIPLMIFYMNSVKEPETALWIQSYPIQYRRGLLEGFCIDNDQNVQLKELHSSNVNI